MSRICDKNCLRDTCIADAYSKNIPNNHFYDLEGTGF